MQFSGTLELAALAPNLLIFNAFTYTLNALCVATVRYAAASVTDMTGMKRMFWFCLGRQIYCHACMQRHGTVPACRGG